jgi:predicted O-linked N-acetylglucosamine transferase (SPINDLY family)
LKNFNESEEYLLQALLIDDGYQLAYRNIIHLYSETQRWCDAVPFCSKYYLINPGNQAAELYAVVLRKTGDFLALKSFVAEHLASYSSSPQLQTEFAGAAFDLGEADQAYSAFVDAADLTPEDFAPRSNALLAANHYWEEPEKLFLEHLAQCSKISIKITELANHKILSSKVKGNTKKKIGYLSTDFKTHAVMQIFSESLLSHNCEKFDYYIYNLNSKSDSTTEKLKQSLLARKFHWQDIFGMEINAVKTLIQSEAVDLIVDLSSHTAGGTTIPLLASKLAPLQATYLGYPNTTGLYQVGYRITDSIADPVGLTEKFHTEKLIRVDSPFLCIQKPNNLPEKIVTPASINGYITFGYVNKLLKLTDATLRLWGKLFERNPRARLFIKAGGLQYPATKNNLEKRLLDNGIKLNRVLFSPHVENHLEQYNKIDVYLDPFPYNGTVNSIEALWMGVPILTLAGPSHVSRVGASLMTAIGLGEFVAEDEAKYLDIAATFCSNPQLTAGYKLRIRSMLEGHSASDPSVLFKKLEAAYDAIFSDKVL